MFCWVAGSDELGNIESLIGNSDEEKGRSSKVPKKGARGTFARLDTPIVNDQ